MDKQGYYFTIDIDNQWVLILDCFFITYPTGYCQQAI
jgi:hypothetical protein